MTRRKIDIVIFLILASMVSTGMSIVSADVSIGPAGCDISRRNFSSGRAGQLTGFVTHDTTYPIENATVTIIEAGLSELTNSDGSYTFTSVPPDDNYTVKCEATGYNTMQVAGITITDLETTTLNFNLTYPLINVTPSSFEITLEAGSEATDYLHISNTGTGDLEFTLSTTEETLTGAYGSELMNSHLVHFPDINTPSDMDILFSTSKRYFAGDFVGTNPLVYYGIDYDWNTLYRIDLQTGDETVVGTSTPLTDQFWSGMAGTSDGRIYASSTGNNVSFLYMIDPVTAEATVIGEITNGPAIIGLAINNNNELYGLDILNDNILRINTTTGEGTIIGSIGYNANYAQGMDFDPLADVLYLATFNVDSYRAELRTVDLSTGNTTLVGLFPNGTEIDALGIAGGYSPDWLSLDPTTGTVSPGNTEDVEVTFDATNLGGGDYDATIYVYHNSGDETPINIPVLLHVSEGSPPTATPTVSPSLTPTPSPTPECEMTGMTFLFPSEHFDPGDTFYLTAVFCNKEGHVLANMPYTVVLDVAGYFWFYPSWSMEFDYDTDTFTEGKTQIEILPEFDWPKTNTTGDARFYGAVLTSSFDDIIGDFAFWSFTWE